MIDKALIERVEAMVARDKFNQLPDVAELLALGRRVYEPDDATLARLADRTCYSWDCACDADLREKCVIRARGILKALQGDTHGLGK